MELYGSFALRPGDEVAFAGAMLMCMGIGMVLSVACYVLEALSLLYHCPAAWNSEAPGWHGFL